MNKAILLVLALLLACSLIAAQSESSSTDLPLELTAETLDKLDEGVANQVKTSMDALLAKLYMQYELMRKEVEKAGQTLAEAETEESVAKQNYQNLEKEYLLAKYEKTKASVESQTAKEELNRAKQAAQDSLAVYNKISTSKTEMKEKIQSERKTVEVLSEQMQKLMDIRDKNARSQ